MTGASGAKGAGEWVRFGPSSPASIPRTSLPGATDRARSRSCADVMEHSAIGPSGALDVTPVTALQFEDFFEAEHVRLGRALYLLTGSTAEADELTQEAMVR